MKAFELRVLAVPTDGRGRMVGAPCRSFNDLVWAPDVDLARSTARELIAARGKDLISIAVSSKTSLVAYVKA